MDRAGANANAARSFTISSKDELETIQAKKRLFVFEDQANITEKRIQELDELLYKIVRQYNTPNSVRDSIRMLCVFLNMNTLGICLFDQDKKITHVDGMLDLNLNSLVGKNFNAFCNLLDIENRITLPGEKMQVHFIKNSKSFMVSFYEYQSGYVAIIYNLTELMPELERIMGMGKAVQYLWTILDSSVDGIVVVDSNLQVIYFNRAFALLSGVEAQNHFGVNTQDMVTKGIYNLSVSNAVLQRKKSVSLLQEYQNGNRCLVTGNPVFDDKGNIQFVVLNVRPLNVLERLEALKPVKINTRVESRYESTPELVFESRAMSNIFRMAINVAGVDSPVMIYGEPGVGKGTIAELLHNYNEERNKFGFIKLNCAAIPRDLLESELFGKATGTISTGSRKSVFEMADNGTLFLEDIEVLPLELQTKLLNFLHDQQINRLGEDQIIKTNVRIIAATGADLMQMISDGTFRADLYYRLSVIPITIPPLRERQEDIVALAKYLLEKFNESYGFNKHLDQEVLDLLVNYDWPGNALELTNLIERLVVTVAGDTITVQDLPSQYLCINKQTVSLAKGQTLNEALEAFEKQYLKEAFDQYGSSYKVAEELGLSQTTAYRKAKKYNLI